MSDPNQNRDAIAWQTGVWNRMSDVYVREIDQRFAPVVDALVARSGLRSGEHVLDLGTGTGAVAQRAAVIVGRTAESLASTSARRCCHSRGTLRPVVVSTMSRSWRDALRPSRLAMRSSMSCSPRSV